jgi:hypothetical protein
MGVDDISSPEDELSLLSISSTTRVSGNETLSIRSGDNNLGGGVRFSTGGGSVSSSLEDPSCSTTLLGELSADQLETLTDELALADFIELRLCKLVASRTFC